MRKLTILISAQIVYVLLSAFISFVEIDDTGNPPASDGTGSVNYPYSISKYEISNAEYCQFLNNVVSQKDSLNLYSPLMGQHFFGGILFDTISANSRHRFFVKDGYENKPVSGVSWESAIRYINWLHYNALNIRDNKNVADFVSLTEGDKTHGAYNTVTWERNSGALYWLPNRDEWNKALYYDGKQWKETFLDSASNSYNKVTGWHYPFPHLADMGISGPPSHYGTLDQQGNLAEWIEDKNGEMRVALGGSLIRPMNFAGFGQSEGDFQNKSIPSFGFRICRNTDLIRKLTHSPEIFIPEFKKTNTIVQRQGPNGGVFVLINHPDNESDRQNQFKGRVGYEFYISKYELTNGEYCRFLNAVASRSDKYHLYDGNMGSSVGGGIQKDSLPDGRWVYTCRKDALRLPVVYIGYYELARYCNWLHYGCPKGEQTIGITEGTGNRGAYDTSDFENVRSGRKQAYASFGQRNPGARFWIPNDDEWYKAAYYDPTKIGNRKYHDYPTRTSDIPLQSQANFMRQSTLSVGAPRYYAPVDSFGNAESYFGTRQQGGNVWEWIEGWQYGSVGIRTLRGGSWQYTEYGLNAVNEDPGGIDDKSYLFGGRIAMAADLSTGFVPSKISVLTRYYQWIQTQSPTRTILISLVIAGLFLCLLLSIIFVLIKWRLASKNI